MPQAKQPPRRVPRVVSGAELRSQEQLISIFGTGRLPGDIVSEEDFSDPLLKSLYTQLAKGRSPASLVEEQDSDELRARVSQLLLTPPGDDTDQLISMAHDCLNALRRKRIEDRMQEVMRTINTLQGDQKAAALAEVSALTAQLKSLKQAKS